MALIKDQAKWTSQFNHLAIDILLTINIILLHVLRDYYTVFGEQRNNIMNCIKSITIVAALLTSPYSIASTCEDVSNKRVTPSKQDEISAAALYANERRNDSPYRSKQEIAKMLAQVNHIIELSKACDIPISEIDANKYFELTGNLLF